jgi:hypothetical protein
MKRIVISGFGALLIAAFVGVIGCDSGGIEPGIPKDNNSAPPLDTSKVMSDMKAAPKAPSGDAIPAPTTPEKK